MLSALAGATERIGLIATGSTTFDAPYHVARRFASLDHISGGRAGWNIVTTSNPDAALNFGLDDHMEHAERYKRAREFFDVVTGLWDSFADDAFPRDVEQGLYFDPAKMHVLDHKGKYLKVRGPLNIARPVQGWPVIVQAGASDDGRQLAAETAEAVFTGGSPLPDSQKLYADIKGRIEKAAAIPSTARSCPVRWCSSATASRKQKRSARSSTASCITTAASPRSRSRSAPTPPASILTDSCRRSPRATPARPAASAWSMSRRATSSPCASWLSASARYGGLAFVGTPKLIADQMEEWLMSRGCDGFNIMFPYLPEGLNDFVDRVIPELQKRGIFRKEYEGRTLRENLGLPRPKNRFFEG